VGDKVPQSADDRLLDSVDENVSDSVQWALRMRARGLLREDEVEEAATLRAAALSVKEAGQSLPWSPWKQVPRHRRNVPERAIAAAARRREA